MSLRPGANVVPGVTFIRPLGPSMVDSATHVQEPSGFRLKPLCIAVIYRPLLLLALTWACQDDAPVWLVPPVGVPADQDLKPNHPAVMASVAAVTGIPVNAWRRQSIAMPRRRAASTTMMLAIEPTISRLPARVLTSASIGPENGSVAAGSSSITAGTVGSTVGNTKEVAKNGAGAAGRGPPGAGARGARRPRA